MKRGLASRWVCPAAVLLAILLASPALDNGLEADDIFHRAVMTGSSRIARFTGGPQDMFRFISGDPDEARESMDLGFLPWWTCPTVKAEFLQLLTVQTHVLDYHLWPDRPDLMHAHSLLWLGLLVLLAGIFYRRLLGHTWMAGMAVLLFAVDDAHGAPAGWICNRNVLLAASFGIGCLIAHDVWRRNRSRTAFWTALVLWACSLLSKEAGIATSAYLAAYALWLDDSTAWRRVATLVPYGLVLVVWRTARDLAGYGVRDLGFYVDPITDPGRFVSALVERYPVLLLGQWATPPADLSILFRRLLGSPLWWAAISVVAVLATLFWPLLRRDRLARFFATGMLLAVVPICATFPSDRLLTFVGVGAMGLLVRFWHFTFSAEAERPQTLLWRVPAVVVAVLLGLVHLMLAPLLLPARAGNPVGPDWLNRGLYINLTFDESIEDQDLIVLNPPSAMHAAYYPIVCEHEGKPVPRAMRSLAPGIMPLTVRRPDRYTLVITPQGGFMSFFLDRLFRNEDHPFTPGDRVELRGLAIEIDSVTSDGRPAVAAFRFDRPLEDPSYRWIFWRQGTFQETFQPGVLPNVGEEVVIDPQWPPIEELFTRRKAPEGWQSSGSP